MAASQDNLDTLSKEGAAQGVVTQNNRKSYFGTLPIRYARIFLLHFQDVFQNRSRSFVWFLLSLLNPLVVLLFWRGAFQNSSSPLGDWTYNAIAGYYLLLVIAGSFLQVHIEEDIARRDIQLGFLSQYLMRPFSYILMKFFQELPWRIIQGFFGVLVLLLFSFFIIKNGIVLVHDPAQIIASIIILVLAFSISFLFKMIVGISALWITEFSGLQELIGVVDIIFAGFIMPLALFPPFIKTLSYVLPFAYMIYFPIISLLGRLTTMESLQTIGIQVVWLMIFGIIYRMMWQRGIKKFTALGQ